MKKNILISVLLFVFGLVSAKQSYSYEYNTIRIYQETLYSLYENTSNVVILTNPRVYKFTADNDNEAKRKVEEYFLNAKKRALQEVGELLLDGADLDYKESPVDDNLKTIIGDKSFIIAGEKKQKLALIEIPVNYTLSKETKKGQYTTIVRSYDFYKKTSPITSNSTVVAFADLEFGISASDVKKRNIFNKFIWNEREQSLTGSFKVGLYDYSLKMLFFENKLYQMVFSSYTSNNYYSNKTKIYDEIKNMRDVLWKAYDIPSDIYALPNNIPTGEQPYYVWQLPGKTIEVGSENKDDKKYRMYCTITSVNLLNQMKYQKDELEKKEKDELINSRKEIRDQSSELFK